jgi:mRNA interferase MazF
MMLMPSFSRNEVILVRYPFSDLAAAKIRPAVVISVPDPSDDYLVVPLTSRGRGLRTGEFVLADWQAAGLNLPSTAKRGIYTVHAGLVLKSVGRLSLRDAQQLDQSLHRWLGFS